MSPIDLLYQVIERKKNMSTQKSSLDNIKGLGPKKKKDLMNYFKSIQSIKSASVDDLCKV